MNPHTPITWKEAFLKSPGPRSFKEAAAILFKGLCMGSADIIPGVSGGTIALITGIYERLILAIRSVDIAMVRRFLSFDFKGAISQLHVRFLLSLLSGIGIAVISLARVMNYLLNHYPIQIWSLFFGLILASIFIVGNEVKNWKAGTITSFIAGTVLAFIIVGLIPVSTPETLWFIFISGLIAICAMILPGLSGAFILLILGKYEFITATLKNPFEIQNMLIIFVFCSGCLMGLIGFSRVLNFFLTKYHSLTLALLTGLMAGSMRKIWPWKEPAGIETGIDSSITLGYRNVFPGELNEEFAFSMMLIIIGLTIVFLLERLSKAKL